MRNVRPLARIPRGFACGELTHARVKMYKSRLARWGYSKNLAIKNEDVLPLLLALEAGDETHVDVRGQQVDRDRLSRYFRRKNMSTEALLRSHSKASPFRHPMPLLQSSAISSPQVCQRSEAVIAVTQRCAQGFLDSNKRPAAMLRSLTRESTRTKLMTGCNFLVLCGAEILRTDIALAGEYFRRVAERMEELIRLESWRAVLSIFRIVLEIQNDNGNLGRPRMMLICRAMLRHVADLSAIYHTPLNPLYQLVVQLLRLDEQDLTVTITVALKCFEDSFAPAFGRQRTEYIMSTQMGIWPDERDWDLWSRRNRTPRPVCTPLFPQPFQHGRALAYCAVFLEYSLHVS